MAAQQRITPTLQLLEGEAAGRLFELDRPALVLGRHASCDIVLDDETVSQRHALLVHGRDGVRIEDLKSRNGVSIDGQMLDRPALLRDGQTIQLGRVKLAYRAVEIREGATGLETLSGILDAAGGGAAGSLDVRPEVKLRALLEIGRALGGSLDPEGLLEQTLEALFQIFPQADRGFVLLKDRFGDLVPKAVRTRPGSSQPMSISRTILELVVERGRAIYSADTASDGRFHGVSSVTRAIQSMMCVPLLDTQRRPIGILQVDSGGGRGRFGQEDLDLLVAVIGPVGLAVQNARLHQVLLRQTALDQELRHARQVQQALLPRRRPGLAGYAFWDDYQPAHLVGGDYFGYLPLARPDAPPGTAPRWAVVLADVMGKGMPAALLMARLSAEVRVLLLTEPDPARAVERLNQELYDAELGERFITFLLVLLDGQDHRLTIVNAGHWAPLIRRAGGRVEVIGQEQSGMSLAVFDDQSYQAVATGIEPGDVVLLYTDGVNEAMNPRNEPFGSRRLHQALLAAPGPVPAVGQAVLRAVQAHTAGQDQSDDITLVCFGRER